jgi:transcriptional regulator with XRE-family HTH domain
MFRKIYISGFNIFEYLQTDKEVLMAYLTRGERFKDARVVHNQNGKQTMVQVSTAAKVSQSTISDLENDDSTRRVNFEDVASLAKHYGVSGHYLLGLTDDPKIYPSAVDELGLSPAAVKEIKELKHYAESSQAPDGDFCRMLAALNSFLSSNRFSWFLAYIVKAERAAKQTRDAYKPFEDQKRAKKPGLPTGPVSFADRESYGYAKYLCISNFEKMLDAFCKAEDLDV